MAQNFAPLGVSAAAKRRSVRSIIFLFYLNSIADDVMQQSAMRNARSRGKALPAEAIAEDSAVPG